MSKTIAFMKLPEGLHPTTAGLVARFASAMAEKLRAAELKHGYTDAWAQDDWMDECQDKLLRHLDKGDPLDVANYCAFLWHHGKPTTLKPLLDEVEAPLQVELAAAIDQSTRLAAQFQDALNMPGASWLDMVAQAKVVGGFDHSSCCYCGRTFGFREHGGFHGALKAACEHEAACAENPHVQEIAILKAEVGRLDKGWTAASQTILQLEAGRDGWIKESDLWQRRHKNLEAKLDDIRAINRVAEMVNARPDDAEPWHFQGLVQSVLDQ